MKPSLFCSRVCALALLVAIGAPSHARAQSSPSAESAAAPGEATEQKVKGLRRTGFSEYKKGHYEAARVAFAQAWELQPQGALGGALADVEMRLGRYGDAAEHWEAYLESAPPDRSQAQAQLDECKEHVSRVLITLFTWEDLLVDGTAVTKTWSAGFQSGRVIWLTPGLHAFEARDQEDPDKIERRELEVTLGQKHQLEFRPFVGPVSGSPPAPAVAPPSPARDRAVPTQPASARSNTRTIVTVTGAVLTVGAASLGVISVLGANAADGRRANIVRQLKDTAPTGVGPGFCEPMREDYATVKAQCAELVSEVANHNSLAARANVSFITAGVLGVATVVTFLLWPQQARAVSRNGLTVLPLPVAGSRGVAIEATF